MMGTKPKNLSPRQALVEAAIGKLESYVRTYGDQEFYRDYPDETIVKDMVYGIGIALWGENHRGPSGYERTVTRIDHILNKRPV